MDTPSQGRFLASNLVWLEMVLVPYDLGRKEGKEVAVDFAATTPTDRRELRAFLNSAARCLNRPAVQAGP